MIIILYISCTFLCILLFAYYGLPENIDPTIYPRPDKDTYLEGAEPINLTGKKDVAILMIHGFEGSPYTFKPMANFLNHQGYHIIAPLLPGHGTSVNDFKQTRYEHWLEYISKIYKEERPKYKDFFILGFSLGGNLSLRLAGEVDKTNPPTGIIAIATPLTVLGFLGNTFICLDWRLFFTGLLKEFIDFIPKPKHLLVSNIVNPWVGYTDVSTTACAHSLKMNMGKARKAIKNITRPICLIQSQNDRTVPIPTLHYIANQVQSISKYILAFDADEDLSSRHRILRHEATQNKVFHYVLHFLQDILSEIKETNYSRTGWFTLLKNKK